MARISDFDVETHDPQPMLYVAPFGEPNDRYPERLSNEGVPYGVMKAGTLREEAVCVLVDDERTSDSYGHSRLNPGDDGYDEAHRIWTEGGGGS